MSGKRPATPPMTFDGATAPTASWAAAAATPAPAAPAPVPAPAPPPAAEVVPAAAEATAAAEPVASGTVERPTRTVDARDKGAWRPYSSRMPRDLHHWLAVFCRIEGLDMEVLLAERVARFREHVARTNPNHPSILMGTKSSR